MKKYLALILALLMVFSCVACGNNTDENTTPSDTTPSDTTPSDTTPDDTASSDGDSAESAVVLVAEESGKGFPCVLLDNESVFWVKGVTSCAQIIDINDLKDAPMASIEVIDGVIHIIGDEIPDWFLEEEETMTKAVMDAMAEWEVAEEVDLSDLEYKGPDVTDPISIEAESTEEGNIFACVVMDNGHVEWAEGVTLPSEYGVENPNSVMVQMSELPNGAWGLMVVGEIPGWFNDDIIKNVKEAFVTWLNGEDAGGAGAEVVDVEGPVVVDAEDTEPGRKFACAVKDNGHVFWEQEVTVPSELGHDDAVQIQILHLPGNIWEMHVIGEMPGWFDDTMVQNVKDAFNEWMNADAAGEPEPLVVEGPVVVDAEDTEPGRKFACAVKDNGHVFWEQEITVPSELGHDDAVQIQILHLPGNIWEMHVIGEMPDWFDDTMVQNVKDAFQEWMAAG